MADQVFMYGIVAGVFAVLTGILFGSRVKRHSGEAKMRNKKGLLRRSGINSVGCRVSIIESIYSLQSLF
jgi:hypothetical protein